MNLCHFACGDICSPFLRSSPFCEEANCWPLLATVGIQSFKSSMINDQIVRRQDLLKQSQLLPLCKDGKLTILRSHLSKLFSQKKLKSAPCTLNFLQPLISRLNLKRTDPKTNVVSVVYICFLMPDQSGATNLCF